MAKPIDWLNYQHLLYFWMVARHGTVTEAARLLHLSSPTVSSQLKKLEISTGRQLLRPKGRKLELTDAGQVVLRYADQIFGLTNELAEALEGKSSAGRVRLRVGIVDAVPKLIVHRLLTPILQMTPSVQLHCSEGMLDALTEQLASHNLDVVLSDTPVPPRTGRGVYNHLLGHSSTTFFASAEIVPETDPRSLREILETIALLLPATGSALRRQLDHYFDDHDISPLIAHEFNDTALMKVFGEAGAGIFPGPTVIEGHICQQYAVRAIDSIDAVRETFYALTTDREIAHPAVQVLTKAAVTIWEQAKSSIVDE